MQRMKWEQEWIDEAKRLGREMWEAFYRFDEEKREDVDAMEVSHVQTLNGSPFH